MIKVFIVGLGLIGGSIARALKRDGGYFVGGFDVDRVTLESAAGCGALDSVFYEIKDVLDADLVIIALPPLLVYPFLRENIGFIKEGCVITDVCGVKTSIVRQCGAFCRENGRTFIGGHPMAGKERGGFSNSDPDLFCGASYILTPQEGTADSDLLRVKEYVAALGAVTVLATPELHDEVIAYTSQLPHAIAFAYTASPTFGMEKGFSAGSFKDVSRVAVSDSALWQQLFSLNKQYLVKELDVFIDNLRKIRDGL